MKTHPVAHAPRHGPSQCPRARAVVNLRTLSVVSTAIVVWGTGLGCSSADHSSRQSSSDATVPITVVEQPEEPRLSQSVSDAPPAPVAAVVPQAGELSPPDLPPLLSPSAEEVVHLAQARVGDDVILAYIDGVDTPFVLDAETIVYLTDLGVPAETVAAMVRRDQILKGQAELAGMATSPPEDSSPTDVAWVEVPPDQAVPTDTMTSGPPPSAPAAESVAVTEPPTQITNNYFYTTLSPYGTWVDLPDYGWCWQPSVAVAQADWRPYCHGGRWIWSDCGWYWQSYYSWGWAPFHYGRWHLSSNCGWVWVPGTRWAPAWVTWRYYDGYCGWAPLPPAAYYTSGIGFTYYGSRVGFSFGFGLTSGCYSFVPTSYFYTSRPWTYCVPTTTVNKFYGNTTVINNYVNGNNNTIINRGIGTDTIAAASREEIRRVRVTDTAGLGSRGEVRAERLSRDGTTLAAYRPQLPEQSSRPPAAVTQRQEQAAVRSENLVESRAVAAARLRASSSDNRARLSQTNPLSPTTTSSNARPTSEPISSAATATRPGTRYSAADRTLPFRGHSEDTSPGRVEPRRSGDSSSPQRSLATQSPTIGRTIPSSGRVEPRLSRTPAQPTQAPGSTETRRSPSVDAGSLRNDSRATMPSRIEPRRTRPEVAIPTPRTSSVGSSNPAYPTTRDFINSGRSPSARDPMTRRTVQIPQRLNRPSQPTRSPSYQTPPVQRPSPTPPTRAYPSRSTGASRPTYTPPPPVQRAPSPAPSSGFRSSPPTSRSAPAARPAPSSPSRSGARSIQRR